MDECWSINNIHIILYYIVYTPELLRLLLLRLLDDLTYNVCTYVVHVDYVGSFIDGFLSNQNSI